jgi:hypothetical protein
MCHVTSSRYSIKTRFHSGKTRGRAGETFGLTGVKFGRSGGVGNQLPGVTDSGWEGLGEFEEPFLTIWGDNDPGTLGQLVVAERLWANGCRAAGGGWGVVGYICGDDCAGT